MQCLQTAMFPLVWPHVLRVAVIAYFAKVCKQSITLDIPDHISWISCVSDMVNCLNMVLNHIDYVAEGLPISSQETYPCIT